MKNLSYLLLLLFLSFGLTWGCSPESDEEKESVPQIQLFEIETSISASNTNQNAIYVKNTAESFDFMSAFVIQAGSDASGWTKNGNVWTYIVAQGTHSIKLELIDNGESCTYNYYMSGQEGPLMYNNFLFMQGVYRKDGSAGTWKMFDTEDGTTGWLYSVYDYSKNLTTKVTDISYQEYSTSEHDVVYFIYDCTINADKSGTYSYKIYDMIYEVAVWNADGSGSITHYLNGVAGTPETW